MRCDLKPSVLTLARLLPMTFIFLLWDCKPETPVHMLAERPLIILSSVGKNRLLLFI